MLGIFIGGIDRRGEIGVSEAANGDAVIIGTTIALPEHARSAIGAEMKADFEAAIGSAAVDFMFALDANLALPPTGAGMNDRASAALARFAMAEIDALGLASGDRLQLATVALSDALHACVSQSSGARHFPPRGAGCRAASIVDGGAFTAQPG